MFSGKRFSPRDLHRELRDHGPGTTEDLMRRIGCSKSTLGSLIRGSPWAHKRRENNRWVYYLDKEGR